MGQLVPPNEHSFVSHLWDSWDLSRGIMLQLGYKCVSYLLHKKCPRLVRGQWITDLYMLIYCQQFYFTRLPHCIKYWFTTSPISLVE